MVYLDYTLHSQQKRMLDITLYSETGCSSSKEQVVFYLSSLSQCTYGKHVTKAFFGKAVDYNMMHEYLHNPVWAIIYIVCVIAVVFHFSNGLWSFLVTWGILQSKNHNVSSHGYR